MKKSVLLPSCIVTTKPPVQGQEHCEAHRFHLLYSLPPPLPALCVFSETHHCRHRFELGCFVESRSFKNQAVLSIQIFVKALESRLFYRVKVSSSCQKSGSFIESRYENQEAAECFIKSKISTDQGANIDIFKSIVSWFYPISRVHYDSTARSCFYF